MSANARSDSSPVRQLFISAFDWDTSGNVPLLTAPALEAMGLLQPVGTIAHLWPSTQRALFARKVYKGLRVNYPVAVGGNFQVPQKAMLKAVVGSRQLRNAGAIEKGVELFDRVATMSAPKSLQISLAGGFHDLHALLFGDDTRAEQFSQTVSSVVLMSGTEMDDYDRGIPKLDTNGFMTPDETGNNVYDIGMTRAVYRYLQEQRIPITIVTREAGYKAQDVGDDGLTIDQFWRTLAKTGHETVRKLTRPNRLKVRDAIIDAQWSQVFLRGDVRWFPEGPSTRPRDVNWFLKGQISGEARRREALRRGANGKVHDLVSEVHLNTLTQLAGIPLTRDSLFSPRTFEINGTRHMIIGIGEDRGIRDPRKTTDFILKLALSGLELSMNPDIVRRKQIIQWLFEAVGVARTPETGAVLS